ncbi:MAG: sensor histidine kinase [Vicinamibacteria bacterium]|nr:sensor histidine kinase [Vicinamibacteria bacterium]
MKTPEEQSEREAKSLALRWLVQVRWVAVFGQLGAIVAARDFIQPPVLALLAVALVTAATNVLASRLQAKVHAALPGALLLLDVVLLTFLLSLTGGAANPFSIFYLAYITLSAVVLSARWTAALALSSILLYGLLFWLGSAPGEAGAHDHGFDAHLRGMWVAFVLSACLVSFFVIRLRATIEQHERDLAAERFRAARSERAAALVTLAAGAAHELATPLGTIAVVAGELGSEISRADTAQIAADLRLIRSEVDRCRAILDDLAAGAGEAPGERPRRERVEEIIGACVEALPPVEAARVTVSIEPADAAVEVPPRALRRCLSSLVRNALDASESGTSVEIEARESSGSMKILVRDHGRGMSAEDLARAGDPFWTTKPPGRGMGLGLFLVRVTLERIGGGLALHSSPAKGTTATMSLPLVAGPA